MRVQIRIPDDAWEKLSELAYSERRTPKMQAEYIILRALGWQHPPAHPVHPPASPDPRQQAAPAQAKER